MVRCPRRQSEFGFSYATAYSLRIMHLSEIFTILFCFSGPSDSLFVKVSTGPPNVAIMSFSFIGIEQNRVVTSVPEKSDNYIEH